MHCFICIRAGKKKSLNKLPIISQNSISFEVWFTDFKKRNNENGLRRKQVFCCLMTYSELSLPESCAWRSEIMKVFQLFFRFFKTYVCCMTGMYFLIWHEASMEKVWWERCQHYCFRISLLVEQSMCSCGECPLCVMATKRAPSAQGEAVPAQSRAEQALSLPGWQCWAWGTPGYGCTFWLPGQHCWLSSNLPEPPNSFLWGCSSSFLSPQSVRVASIFPYWM